MQAANDRKAKQQFSHKGSHGNAENHSKTRVPNESHSKGRVKTEGGPVQRVLWRSSFSPSSAFECYSREFGSQKGHWASEELLKWYQQQMP